jgi:hypothetical protein
MINRSLEKRLVNNLSRQIGNVKSEDDIFDFDVLSDDLYASDNNYIDACNEYFGDAEYCDIYGIYKIARSKKSKELAEKLNQETNGLFFYKEDNVYYCMTCMCSSVIRDFKEIVINGRPYC